MKQTMHMRSPVYAYIYTGNVDYTKLCLTASNTTQTNKPEESGVERANKIALYKKNCMTSK